MKYLQVIVKFPPHNLPKSTSHFAHLLLIRQFFRGFAARGRCWTFSGGLDFDAACVRTKTKDEDDEPESFFSGLFSGGQRWRRWRRRGRPRTRNASCRSALSSRPSWRRSWRGSPTWRTSPAWSSSTQKVTKLGQPFMSRHWFRTFSVQFCIEDGPTLASVSSSFVSWNRKLL